MKLPDLLAEAWQTRRALHELTGTPQPAGDAITGPHTNDSMRAYLTECVNLDHYLTEQGFPNV